MTINLSSLTMSISDAEDDFQAFQMRPVVRDHKLSAALFASNGNIILICGKSHREQQRMLLLSYEIPSTTESLTASVRLLSVARLTKTSVTQLEAIPKMKIVLLLGDGIVSLFDIDSLLEITRIPINNVTCFSTWYDIRSDLSTRTTSVTLSSSFTSLLPIVNELRICVPLQNYSLGFYRWLPEEQILKENIDPRGTFDLIDIPRAIACSRDKICICYEKSYVIMCLETGMIIHELKFNIIGEPIINFLQDRTHWCVQKNRNTVFLDSNFEPIHESKITWKDFPLDIIQTNPYVLALTNQSIAIRAFIGSQSVSIQQISLKAVTTIGKGHLWMDAQNGRIYAATPNDVFSLEPVPIHIQLKNYLAIYRYDLALTLIQAKLGISILSSVDDKSRIDNGHAKGNLDISTMPKEITFENDEKLTSDIPVHEQTLINSSSSDDQNLSETTLWNEYYRVGTMYAFQLFHQEQFQQAFAEFRKFLTDPAEIISLFEPLSANTWLTNSYYNLNTFVGRHQHFSEPDDFVEIKLKNALYELQKYLTDSHKIFQTIFRCSPNSWLEVQSLVQNRFILKTVRDLLIIVETALLKVYLIDQNYTLANALLQNQDNFCLSSEIERELKKHSQRTELLVLFYQKQNRHKEVLQLMTNNNSSTSNNTILNYLSKLDNDQLPLIFQYVRPIIKSALGQQNSENLLHNILILFVGESTSPSTINRDRLQVFKYNPMEVYGFLKDVNQDFALQYLKNITLKLELGVDNTSCNQLKLLSDELKQLIATNPQGRGNDQINICQDIMGIGQPSNLNAKRGDGTVYGYDEKTLHRRFNSLITTNLNPLIQVCKGDLITQQTDVIVVCSSSKYLFYAIYNAGGDSFKASFQKESKKKSDASFIAIKAEGQLASKKVYFLPWKMSSNASLLCQSIKKFVADAIEKAIAEKYQSIAFPAIGCGQYGCSISLVAQTMVEEAYQKSQKYPISILFVIQPDKADVYDAFEKQINLIQRPPQPTEPVETVSVAINKGTIDIQDQIQMENDICS